MVEQVRALVSSSWHSQIDLWNPEKGRALFYVCHMWITAYMALPQAIITEFNHILSIYYMPGNVLNILE